MNHRSPTQAKQVAQHKKQMTQHKCKGKQQMQRKGKQKLPEPRNDTYRYRGQNRANTPVYLARARPALEHAPSEALPALSKPPRKKNNPQKN